MATRQQIQEVIDVLQAGVNGLEIQKRKDGPGSNSYCPDYATVSIENLDFLVGMFRLKPVPRPYWNMDEFISKGYNFEGGSIKTLRLKHPGDLKRNEFRILAIHQDHVVLTNIETGDYLYASYKELCDNYLWTSGGKYCGVTENK